MKKLAITALLALGVCSSSAAQNLILENARIVDPESKRVTEGTLFVDGGRIVAGPGAERIDFEGERLDLKGKWVIPGLVDLHTHSYGNMAPGNTFDSPGTAVVAKRMLYAGVTGFLDLFGNEESLYSLRESQRAGGLIGADLFASLSCLTATNGHCTEYGVPTRVMSTPEEARRQVAELAEKRPDVVKLVYAPTGGRPSIDRKTLAAAVAEATARDLKTVIHVNTWQDVRDAVEVDREALLASAHSPASPASPDDGHP